METRTLLITATHVNKNKDNKMIEVVLSLQEGVSIGAVSEALNKVHEHYGSEFRAELSQRPGQAATVFNSGNCRCALQGEGNQVKMHITSLYATASDDDVLSPIYQDNLIETLKKLQIVFDNIDKVRACIQQQEAKYASTAVIKQSIPSNAKPKHAGATQKISAAEPVSAVKKEDPRKIIFDGDKVSKAIMHLVSYIKSKQHEIKKLKGNDKLHPAELQQAATHLCFAMMQDIILYRPDYVNQTWLVQAGQIIKQISPSIATNHMKEIDDGISQLNKNDVACLPEIFKEITGHGAMVKAIYERYLNPLVKKVEEELGSKNDDRALGFKR